MELGIWYVVYVEQITGITNIVVHIINNNHEM